MMECRCDCQWGPKHRENRQETNVRVTNTMYFYFQIYKCFHTLCQNRGCHVLNLNYRLRSKWTAVRIEINNTNTVYHLYFNPNLNYANLYIKGGVYSILSPTVINMKNEGQNITIRWTPFLKYICIYHFLIVKKHLNFIR